MSGYPDDLRAYGTGRLVLTPAATSGAPDLPATKLPFAAHATVALDGLEIVRHLKAIVEAAQMVRDIEVMIDATQDDDAAMALAMRQDEQVGTLTSLILGETGKTIFDALFDLLAPAKRGR